MSLRVAVITPYHDTPDDWLRQCHDSVRAQTHPCTHILVADGRPQDCVRAFEAQHIVLPVGHKDYGDTPRAVGSMSAIGQGFDAIAYLDADNWYAPDHIASLVELHARTGAAVCTSMRALHRLDGSMMAICLGSDGEQFSDTSCLMLLRPAFRIAAVWALMGPDEHAIADRVLWFHIRRSGLPRAHSGRPTLCYRATHAAMYRDLREPVPPGSNDGNAIRAALQKWYDKGNPHLAVKWAYRLPQKPASESLL